jgi:hypothetical protein
MTYFTAKDVDIFDNLVKALEVASTEAAKAPSVTAPTAPSTIDTAVLSDVATSALAASSVTAEAVEPTAAAAAALAATVEPTAAAPALAATEAAADFSLFCSLMQQLEKSNEIVANAIANAASYYNDDNIVEASNIVRAALNDEYMPAAAEAANAAAVAAEAALADAVAAPADTSAAETLSSSSADLIEEKNCDFYDQVSFYTFYKFQDLF